MRQGIATRPARRWRSWPMPALLPGNAESIDSGLAYALSIATPLFSMLRVGMVFLSTIMRELFGLRGSIEPPGDGPINGAPTPEGERRALGEHRAARRRANQLGPLCGGRKRE